MSECRRKTPIPRYPDTPIPWRSAALTTQGHIIIGTAGHIDHGKTSLVKILTGVDTDRLKEEKERGITIELGFAPITLPSGLRLGLVDVPGHERFVKNMVAGATGIDLVLLVIAADEGVMPQTREHLDICQLLGVKDGVVALTKTDMVEEDWIQMVTEDVREYLSGTFLENAPIVPVSSMTGSGREEMVAAIETAAREIPGRSDQGIFNFEGVRHRGHRHPDIRKYIHRGGDPFPAGRKENQTERDAGSRGVCLDKFCRDSNCPEPAGDRQG